MYTPATKLPLLNLFQWSRPDAPNPRLASPISETDTTISVTSAPKKYDGSIVTGHFLANITNSSGFTELVYVPAGKVSADGLTFTDVVRGVRISGLDYTTGDADFADVHEGDSVVGCAVNAVYALLEQGVFSGTIATGGTGFVIGTEPGAGGETITLYRTTTAGVKLGVLRWYVTTGKCEFSNDGVVWTAIDDVSASDLSKISSADTTPGYLNDKITLHHGTKTITNPGANEELNLDIKGTLAEVITDVSATEAEIDQALDGISANVTATALNTMTAGPSSDASAYHKHSAQTSTYFAYETVTTAKAVAQLPIQCEWFAGLTSTELPLGNTNANRKRSFAFVPSQDVATVPNLSYRVCEAVNGATAVGDMVVRIETDDGTGKPSGTLVHANATYTISQAAQRTAWTETEATAVITWAGAFGLTKGVKVHLVFSCSGTDATNYIKLFGNATSGEYQNYLVFQQYTYSVDTTAWSAVANSYLYIWEATVPFGYGVVHTDADYSGRTFTFIGIVRTGVSAFADVEVYENEAPNQTGLIAGQNYYISATAGDITATATAYSIKIGEATSSTSLKIKKTVDNIVLYTAQGSGVSITHTRPFVFGLKVGSKIKIRCRTVIATGNTLTVSITVNGSSLFSEGFAGNTTNQWQITEIELRVVSTSVAVVTGVMFLGAGSWDTLTATQYHVATEPAITLSQLSNIVVSASCSAAGAVYFLETHIAY